MAQNFLLNDAFHDIERERGLLIKINRVFIGANCNLQLQILEKQYNDYFNFIF